MPAQVVGVNDAEIQMRFFGLTYPGIEGALVGHERCLKLARLPLQNGEIEPRFGQSRPVRENALI